MKAKSLINSGGPFLQIKIDQDLDQVRKFIKRYRVSYVLSLCIFLHLLHPLSYAAGQWLSILNPMWGLAELIILTVLSVSSPLWELLEYYDYPSALVGSKKPPSLEELIAPFRRRGGSLSDCSLLGSAVIIGTVIGSLLDMGRYHDANLMLPKLALAFLAPLIFPITAAGLLTIWLKLKRSFGLIPPASDATPASIDLKSGHRRGAPCAPAVLDTDLPLKARRLFYSFKFQTAETISRFLICKLPFASVCFAYLTGIYMFAFWPLNAGSYGASWLLSSALDAQIIAARAQNLNDPTIALISGVILALVLCRAFAPLVLRLAAFYQLLLQKFAQNTADGNLIDACADAIATPRTKLKVSPQHPNWRSFKESIQYIAVCYTILFCLVAFCPGPLGKTITGWLDASIKDADPVVLSIGKVQHSSMPYYPGMTNLFYIQWRDATHGTYPNNVVINDKAVRKTYIVDAHGVHGVTTAWHKPARLSLSTFARTLQNKYNQVTRAHSWKTACVIGKVLLGIPPWNFSLNYHSDPRAFLFSIIAACDSNNVAPGLPTTVLVYDSRVPPRFWQNLKTDGTYLVPYKTGVRVFHPPQKDPSVYVLDSPLHVIEYDPHCPTDWNTPYVVGRNLSNFPHWHFRLNQYFNLRLFLASIFAAFGVAPFAVMSCAFLPLRRPDEMLLSAQGLLMPNKLIGSPLLLWKDLHTVTLLNKNKVDRSQHVLQLVFRPGGTIKLRLNTLPKESLSELLALADEYGVDCRLDESVVQLRSELASDNNSTSLADAKKFTSTIFQPYVTGQRINDYSIRIVRKLASKSLSAVYLAR